ncbi:hypothetical protein OIDMADRAFT_178260 [Oidiodendron maius Zn]|uniref:Uncharacterized protein n=1 Tax=Oidiodendron maius (strain Zn) TaxID=913774 RepID=A0A0C3H7N7_OIDMZ|nr:hypothetical protein OIDMADRAFT_178260 [Oidiodendron maius Zn]
MPPILNAIPHPLPHAQLRPGLLARLSYPHVPVPPARKSSSCILLQHHCEYDDPGPSVWIWISGCWAGVGGPIGSGGDYVQMRISSGLQRAGHTLLASGTAGGRRQRRGQLRWNSLARISREMRGDLSVRAGHRWLDLSAGTACSRMAQSNDSELIGGAIPVSRGRTRG